MKSLLIALCVLLSTAAQAADSPNLIVVNGVAEKSVEPNMTLLQIESWGKANSAKSAQEIQAAQYLKIKSVVEKYKIKKDDFQTENFTVSPEYIYDQKTQSNKINGYRVTHQIGMIYRKTADVGALVDALTSVAKTEGGGVTIQNISWDNDKKIVVENAALADAVKSARAKAEDLAKAAGVKIKSVHRIQHSSVADNPGRPMMMKMRASDTGGSANTELSSGQVKVRVEVQMEFEI
ncbi:MAG: SIMPL domain-containing protein [Bdellovibrio sp.]|nr:SIMPL domain-containing protein [Bdellovibrio sp.]